MACRGCYLAKVRCNGIRPCKRCCRMDQPCESREVLRRDLEPDSPALQARIADWQRMQGFRHYLHSFLQMHLDGKVSKPKALSMLRILGRKTMNGLIPAEFMKDIEVMAAILGVSEWKQLDDADEALTREMAQAETRWDTEALQGQEVIAGAHLEPALSALFFDSGCPAVLATVVKGVVQYRVNGSFVDEIGPASLLVVGDPVKTVERIVDPSDVNAYLRKVDEACFSQSVDHEVRNIFMFKRRDNPCGRLGLARMRCATYDAGTALAFVVSMVPLPDCKYIVPSLAPAQGASPVVGATRRQQVQSSSRMRKRRAPPLTDPPNRSFVPTSQRDAESAGHITSPPAHDAATSPQSGFVLEGVRAAERMKTDVEGLGNEEGWISSNLMEGQEHDSMWGEGLLELIDDLEETSGL